MLKNAGESHHLSPPKESVDLKGVQRDHSVSARQGTHRRNVRHQALIDHLIFDDWPSEHASENIRYYIIKSLQEGALREGFLVWRTLIEKDPELKNGSSSRLKLPSFGFFKHGFAWKKP